MSGIFFDLPSPRFIRRFRFFETMMRTFASSLLRWLITPAFGSRQVHFRLNEAEFPAASQSACKLFEWTLSDGRAVDGASIDALRPFNNWFKLKDQHHPEGARVVRAGGRDAGATDARAIGREKRKRKKRHSGSGLWHFLETARAQSKQQRAREMVRSLHDQHENLNESKSLRRVFTSATCPSTQPRAISLNCSTVWGTCKMPRS